MKIMSILGSSPMPSHTVMSGIHAMGGMGRRISKMLPSVALKVRLQPTIRPKATPSTQAASTASSTRRRLMRMC